jgi:predicted acetylornithine/succinylornithine family transaminase
MSLAELRALEKRYLMPTYTRMPVEFVRGEGARLWDDEGRRYLDFTTGISVCSVGHCHPKVVAAVREQAGNLMHVSNLAYSEPAMRLAETLVESSLHGRAFLCNSGTEANECAIKLVRKHAASRGVADPEIVVLEGAFHGRTMGALSATPSLAADASFAPYLPGFRTVPRDDPEALAGAVGDSTAAVMIELIQGEAGVHIVPDGVVAAAREACERAGALLVFDEIQTGMGRTGSLWAYEQGPARPDVMTTAKALGGGLPIGACVTAPALGEALTRGDHGSTFAGGPLVTSAALAAVGILNDPALLRRTRDLGARLASGLAEIEGVAEVRGRGLMIGVGLSERDGAAAVATRALEAGLVVNVPEPSSLRLLPPLIIGEAEADEGLAILRDSIPPR